MVSKSKSEEEFDFFSHDIHKKFMTEFRHIADIILRKFKCIQYVPSNFFCHVVRELKVLGLEDRTINQILSTSRL